MLREENVDIFQEDMLDPRAIAQLKKIVEATDASIILSSSWRWNREGKNAVRRQLREKGLDFIGTTPCRLDIPLCRDNEIAVWLKEHPEVESFIILDDNEMNSLALKPFQVKTDFKDGLTREKAEEAILMLKGEQK